MSVTLSEAARGIINAGVEAADRTHDLNEVDRAVEYAVAELSLETPLGSKAQVTDALIQIAKVYVRQQIEGR